MDLREQRFGLEVEMTGITRKQAAEAAAAFFGTASHHRGGGYDTYEVPDGTGRSWKFVTDGSIRTRRRIRSGDSAPGDRAYSVELVSPICRYQDIETIQVLLRRLRGAGAMVNDSCGIHIHVDAAACRKIFSPSCGKVQNF